MDAEFIERELRPFADPATEVSVAATTQLIRIDLIRNGTQHVVSVDTSTGKVRLRQDGDSPPEDKLFISLRSLLASPDYAAVQSLADNQRRMLTGILSDNFIEPEGTIDGGPLSQNAFEEAAVLSVRAAGDRPIDLILIDGAAGVGKTSLISRLVAKRAEQYGREGAEPPILHVANRGRRLVSLDELIALSIQLVRGRFTYDQVPSLIRNGVIQVAIDGFDELVDAEGYADTWAVLREFLEEVERGGPILLAGRDTFFDLTKFNDRLRDVGGRVSISHASLSPITPSAAKSWLIGSGWSQEDVDSAQASDLLKENSYALRPFFLREIANVGGLDALLDNLVSPRDYLVRRFVEREAGLITQRIDLDRDTAQLRLWELFELIALEMAEAETEAVDLPFLQLAVDVTFAPVLSDTDLAKLRHKAGSFALMDVDARQDFRRFPHTEISNHFLASALLKQIVAGQMPRFLRRGYFGSDLLTVMGDQIRGLPHETIRNLQQRLFALVRNDAGAERLGENASSILSGSVVADLDEHLELSGLIAGDVVLFGTPGAAHFKDVSFTRLDCRGADLSAVSFEACRATTLVVDDTTRFGSTAPETGSLTVDKPGGAITYYDPAAITEWLNRHKEQDTDGVALSEAGKLLERICRIFLRQFFIKNDGLDPAGRYLVGDAWHRIEKALSKHGRLRRTKRKDASGPPAEFLHIINAAALLARASQEDRAIWSEI